MLDIERYPASALFADRAIQPSVMCLPEDCPVGFCAILERIQEHDESPYQLVSCRGNKRK